MAHELSGIFLNLPDSNHEQGDCRTVYEGAHPASHEETGTQTERGHHVVTGGPYRWMRHPGYAGALLGYMATPIFLDSYWAFIPALFLTVVLVIRTHLEDKTLQDELEGYREYAKRVHYRLLPGVW